MEGGFTQQELTVPDRLVETIIGENGAGLEYIRKETGAQLSMGAQKDGRSNLIIVSGNQEQVSNAKSFLSSLIEGLQAAETEQKKEQTKQNITENNQVPFSDHSALSIERDSTENRDPQAQASSRLEAQSFCSSESITTHDKSCDKKWEDDFSWAWAYNKENKEEKQEKSFIKLWLQTIIGSPLEETKNTNQDEETIEQHSSDGPSSQGDSLDMTLKMYESGEIRDANKMVDLQTFAQDRSKQSNSEPFDTESKSTPKDAQFKDDEEQQFNKNSPPKEERLSSSVDEIDKLNFVTIDDEKVISGDLMSHSSSVENTRQTDGNPTTDKEIFEDTEQSFSTDVDQGTVIGINKEFSSSVDDLSVYHPGALDVSIISQQRGNSKIPQQIEETDHGSNEKSPIHSKREENLWAQSDSAWSSPVDGGHTGDYYTLAKGSSVDNLNEIDSRLFNPYDNIHKMEEYDSSSVDQVDNSRKGIPESSVDVANSLDSIETCKVDVSDDAITLDPMRRIALAGLGLAIDPVLSGSSVDGLCNYDSEKAPLNINSGTKSYPPFDSNFDNIEGRSDSLQSNSEDSTVDVTIKEKSFDLHSTPLNTVPTIIDDMTHKDLTEPSNKEVFRDEDQILFDANKNTTKEDLVEKPIPENTMDIYDPENTMLDMAKCIDQTGRNPDVASENVLSETISKKATEYDQTESALEMVTEKDQTDTNIDQLETTIKKDTENIQIYIAPGKTRDMDQIGIDSEIAREIIENDPTKTNPERAMEAISSASTLEHETESRDTKVTHTKSQKIHPEYAFPEKTSENGMTETNLNIFKEDPTETISDVITDDARSITPERAAQLDPTGTIFKMEAECVNSKTTPQRSTQFNQTEKNYENVPSETTQMKTTELEQIGPSSDVVTENVPSETTQEKTTELDQMRTCSDLVTENVPLETTPEQTTELDPIGPSSDVVTENIPSETTQEKAEEHDPTRTASEIVTQNIPSETTPEKTTELFPIETSSDVVTETVPSETTPETITELVPIETSSDVVTDNIPSETTPEKTTELDPVGIPSDVVTENIPSETTPEKTTELDLVGIPSDMITENVPSETTLERAEEHDPIGTDSEVVTEKIPSETTPEKTTELDPIGISSDLATENVPSETTPGKTTELDLIGTCSNVVTENVSSETTPEITTELDSIGTASEVVSENITSETTPENTTDLVPIGTSSDVVTENVPSETTPEKAEEHHPTGTASEDVTQNIPSETTPEKTTGIVPIGTSSDVISENVPSEIKTEHTTELDPIGASSDVISENAPSETTPEKTTELDLIGPSYDLITENIPSETTQEKAEEYDPTGTASGVVTENIPSETIPENTTDLVPIGPSYDVITENVPSETTPEKAVEYDPTGTASEVVTQNIPSETTPEKTTELVPIGASADVVTQNVPSETKTEPTTELDPMGTSSVISENAPSETTPEKTTELDPTGTASEVVTQNIPSETTPDKTTEDDPIRTSPDLATENVPSETTPGKTAEIDLIGTCSNVVTENVSSETTPEITTELDSIGTASEVVSENITSETTPENTTDLVPIGTSSDVVTENVPSETTPEKAEEHHPTGTASEDVTQNIPSETTPEKTTGIVPIGTSSDVISENVPSEIKTEHTTELDPIGASSDVISENAPSETTPEKTTELDLIGPSYDLITENIPSETTQEKAEEYDPTGTASGVVTENIPSETIPENTTDLVPIGPSYDVITENVPSETTPEKAVEYDPTGTASEVVTQNIPSETTPEKTTELVPIGASADIVTQNVPSETKTEPTTELDPMGTSSVISENAPSETTPEKTTELDPTGTASEVVTQNIPSETTPDKTTEDDPIRTSPDLATENVPSETTPGKTAEIGPIGTSPDVVIEKISSQTTQGKTTELDQIGISSDLTTENIPSETTPEKTTELDPVGIPSDVVTENIPSETTPWNTTELGPIGTSSDVVTENVSSEATLKKAEEHDPTGTATEVVTDNIPSESTLQKTKELDPIGTWSDFVTENVPSETTPKKSTKPDSSRTASHQVIDNNPSETTLEESIELISPGPASMVVTENVLSGTTPEKSREFDPAIIASEVANNNIAIKATLEKTTCLDPSGTTFEEVTKDAPPVMTLENAAEYCPSETILTNIDKLETSFAKTTDNSLTEKSDATPKNAPESGSTERIITEVATAEAAKKYHGDKACIDNANWKTQIEPPRVGNILQGATKANELNTHKTSGLSCHDETTSEIKHLASVTVGCTVSIDSATGKLYNPCPDQDQNATKQQHCYVRLLYDHRPDSVIQEDSDDIISKFADAKERPAIFTKTKALLANKTVRHLASCEGATKFLKRQSTVKLSIESSSAESLKDTQIELCIKTDSNLPTFISTFEHDIKILIKSNSSTKEVQNVHNDSEEVKDNNQDNINVKESDVNQYQSPVDDPAFLVRSDSRECFDDEIIKPILLTNISLEKPDSTTEPEDIPFDKSFNEKDDVDFGIRRQTQSDHIDSQTDNDNQGIGDDHGVSDNVVGTESIAGEVSDVLDNSIFTDRPNSPEALMDEFIKPKLEGNLCNSNNNDAKQKDVENVTEVETLAKCPTELSRFSEGPKIVYSDSEEIDGDERHILYVEEMEKSILLEKNEDNETDGSKDTTKIVKAGQDNIEDLKDVKETTTYQNIASSKVDGLHEDTKTVNSESSAKTVDSEVILQVSELEKSVLLELTSGLSQIKDAENNNEDDFTLDLTETNLNQYQSPVDDPTFLVRSDSRESFDDEFIKPILQSNISHSGKPDDKVEEKDVPFNKSFDEEDEVDLGIRKQTQPVNNDNQTNNDDDVNVAGTEYIADEVPDILDDPMIIDRPSSPEAIMDEFIKPILERNQCDANGLDGKLEDSEKSMKSSAEHPDLSEDPKIIYSDSEEMASENRENIYVEEMKKSILLDKDKDIETEVLEDSNIVVKDKIDDLKETTSQNIVPSEPDKDRGELDATKVNNEVILQDEEMENSVDAPMLDLTETNLNQYQNPIDDPTFLVRSDSRESFDDEFIKPILQSNNSHNEMPGDKVKGKEVPFDESFDEEDDVDLGVKIQAQPGNNDNQSSLDDDANVAGTESIADEVPDIPDDPMIIDRPSSPEAVMDEFIKPILERNQLITCDIGRKVEEAENETVDEKITECSAEQSQLCEEPKIVYSDSEEMDSDIIHVDEMEKSILLEDPSGFIPFKDAKDTNDEESVLALTETNLNRYQSPVDDPIVLVRSDSRESFDDEFIKPILHSNISHSGKPNDIREEKDVPFNKSFNEKDDVDLGIRKQTQHVNNDNQTNNEDDANVAGTESIADEVPDILDDPMIIDRPSSPEAIMDEVIKTILERNQCDANDLEGKLEDSEKSMESAAEHPHLSEDPKIIYSDSEEMDSENRENIYVEEMEKSILLDKDEDIEPEVLEDSNIVVKDNIDDLKETTSQNIVPSEPDKDRGELDATKVNNEVILQVEEMENSVDAPMLDLTETNLTQYQSPVDDPTCLVRSDSRESFDDEFIKPILHSNISHNEKPDYKVKEKEVPFGESFDEEDDVDLGVKKQAQPENNDNQTSIADDANVAGTESIADEDSDILDDPMIIDRSSSPEAVMDEFIKPILEINQFNYCDGSGKVKTRTEKSTERSTEKSQLCEEPKIVYSDSEEMDSNIIHVDEMEKSILLEDPSGVIQVKDVEDTNDEESVLALTETNLNRYQSPVDDPTFLVRSDSRESFDDEFIKPILHSNISHSGKPDDIIEEKDVPFNESFNEENDVDLGIRKQTQHVDNDNQTNNEDDANVAGTESIADEVPDILDDPMIIDRPSSPEAIMDEVIKPILERNQCDANGLEGNLEDSEKSMESADEHPHLSEDPKIIYSDSEEMDSENRENIYVEEMEKSILLDKDEDIEPEVLEDSNIVVKDKIDDLKETTSQNIVPSEPDKDCGELDAAKVNNEVILQVEEMENSVDAPMLDLTETNLTQYQSPVDDPTFLVRSDSRESFDDEFIKPLLHINISHNEKPDDKVKEKEVPFGESFGEEDDVDLGVKKQAQPGNNDNQTSIDDDANVAGKESIADEDSDILDDPMIIARPSSPEAVMDEFIKPILERNHLIACDIGAKVEDAENRTVDEKRTECSAEQSQLCEEPKIVYSDSEEMDSDIIHVDEMEKSILLEDPSGVIQVKDVEDTNDEESVLALTETNLNRYQSPVDDPTFLVRSDSRESFDDEFIKPILHSNISHSGKPDDKVKEKEVPFGESFSEEDDVDLGVKKQAQPGNNDNQTSIDDDANVAGKESIADEDSDILDDPMIIARPSSPEAVMDEFIKPILERNHLIACDIGAKVEDAENRTMDEKRTECSAEQSQLCEEPKIVYSDSEEMDSDIIHVDEMEKSILLEDPSGVIQVKDVEDTNDEESVLTLTETNLNRYQSPVDDPTFLVRSDSRESFDDEFIKPILHSNISHSGKPDDIIEEKDVPFNESFDEEDDVDLGIRKQTQHVNNDNQTNNEDDANVAGTESIADEVPDILDDPMIIDRPSSPEAIMDEFIKPILERNQCDAHGLQGKLKDSEKSMKSADEHPHLSEDPKIIYSDSKEMYSESRENIYVEEMEKSILLDKDKDIETGVLEDSNIVVKDNIDDLKETTSQNIVPSEPDRDRGELDATKVNNEVILQVEEMENPVDAPMLDLTETNLTQYQSPVDDPTFLVRSDSRESFDDEFIKPLLHINISHNEKPDDKVKEKEVPFDETFDEEDDVDIGVKKQAQPGNIDNQTSIDDDANVAGTESIADEDSDILDDPMIIDRPSSPEAIMDEFIKPILERNQCDANGLDGKLEKSEKSMESSAEHPDLSEDPKIIYSESEEMESENRENIYVEEIEKTILLDREEDSEPEVLKDTITVVKDSSDDLKEIKEATGQIIVLSELDKNYRETETINELDATKVNNEVILQVEEMEKSVEAPMLHLTEANLDQCQSQGDDPTFLVRSDSRESFDDEFIKQILHSNISYNEKPDDKVKEKEIPFDESFDEEDDVDLGIKIQAQSGDNDNQTSIDDDANVTGTEPVAVEDSDVLDDPMIIDRPNSPEAFMEEFIKPALEGNQFNFRDGSGKVEDAENGTVAGKRTECSSEQSQLCEEPKIVYSDSEEMDSDIIHVDEIEKSIFLEETSGFIQVKDAEDTNDEESLLALTETNLNQYQSPVDDPTFLVRSDSRESFNDEFIKPVLHSNISCSKNPDIIVENKEVSFAESFDGEDDVDFGLKKQVQPVDVDSQIDGDDPGDLAGPESVAGKMSDIPDDSMIMDRQSSPEAFMDEFIKPILDRNKLNASDGDGKVQDTENNNDAVSSMGYLAELSQISEDPKIVYSDSEEIDSNGRGVIRVEEMEKLILLEKNEDDETEVSKDFNILPKTVQDDFEDLKDIKETLTCQNITFSKADGLHKDTETLNSESNVATVNSEVVLSVDEKEKSVLLEQSSSLSHVKDSEENNIHNNGGELGAETVRDEFLDILDDPLVINRQSSPEDFMDEVIRPILERTHSDVDKLEDAQNIGHDYDSKEQIQLSEEPNVVYYDSDETVTDKEANINVEEIEDSNRPDKSNESKADLSEDTKQSIRNEECDTEALKVETEMAAKQTVCPSHYDVLSKGPDVVDKQPIVSKELGDLDAENVIQLPIKAACEYADLDNTYDKDDEGVDSEELHTVRSMMSALTRRMSCQVEPRDTNDVIDEINLLVEKINKGLRDGTLAASDIIPELTRLIQLRPEPNENQEDNMAEASIRRTEQQIFDLLDSILLLLKTVNLNRSGGAHRVEESDSRVSKDMTELSTIKEKAEYLESNVENYVESHETRAREGVESLETQAKKEDKVFQETGDKQRTKRQDAEVEEEVESHKSEDKNEVESQDVEAKDNVRLDTDSEKDIESHQKEAREEVESQEKESREDVEIQEITAKEELVRHDKGEVVGQDIETLRPVEIQIIEANEDESKETRTKEDIVCHDIEAKEVGSHGVEAKEQVENLETELREVEGHQSETKGLGHDIEPKEEVKSHDTENKEVIENHEAEVMEEVESHKTDAKEEVVSHGTYMKEKVERHDKEAKEEEESHDTEAKEDESHDTEAKEEAGSNETEAKFEAESQDTENKVKEESLDTDTRDDEKSRDTEAKEDAEGHDTEAKEKEESHDTEAKEEEENQDTEAKEVAVSHDAEAKEHVESHDTDTKDEEESHDTETKELAVSHDAEAKEQVESRDTDTKDEEESHDTETKEEAERHDTETKEEGESHKTEAKEGVGSHDTEVKEEVESHETETKKEAESHDREAKEKSESHDTRAKEEAESRDTKIKEEVEGHDTEAKEEVESHDTKSKEDVESHDTEAKEKVKSDEIETKEEVESHDIDVESHGTESKKDVESHDTEAKEEESYDTETNEEVENHDTESKEDVKIHETEAKEEVESHDTATKEEVERHDTEAEEVVESHDTETKEEVESNDKEVESHDTETKEELESHDTETKEEVECHDTEIKEEVESHDTEIKGEVKSHDTEAKEEVECHDTEIKAEVECHDIEAKEEVESHDTEIKEEFESQDAVVKEELKSHTTEAKEEVEIHDTATKEEVESRDTEIKEEVESHDTEAKDEVESHETETKEEVESHDKEVESHNTETKEEVESHDTETKEEVECHDIEAKEEVESLDTEIKEEFESQDTVAKEELESHTTVAKEEVESHDTEIKEEVGSHEIQAEEVESHDTETKEKVESHDTETKEEVESQATDTKEEVGSHDTETNEEVVSQDTVAKEEIGSHDTETKEEVGSHDTQAEEVESHDTETKDEVESHDTETKEEVECHDTEIKEEVGSQDTAAKEEVESHDTEAKQEVESHDTETKEEVENHDTETNEEVESHDTETKEEVESHGTETKEEVESHDQEEVGCPETEEKDVELTEKNVSHADLEYKGCSDDQSRCYVDRAESFVEKNNFEKLGSHAEEDIKPVFERGCGSYEEENDENNEFADGDKFRSSVDYEMGDSETEEKEEDEEDEEDEDEDEEEEEEEEEEEDEADDDDDDDDDEENFDEEEENEDDDVDVDMDDDDDDEYYYSDDNETGNDDLNKEQSEEEDKEEGNEGEEKQEEEYCYQEQIEIQIESTSGAIYTLDKMSKELKPSEQVVNIEHLEIVDERKTGGFEQPHNFSGKEDDDIVNEGARKGNLDTNPNERDDKRQTSKPGASNVKKLTKSQMRRLRQIRCKKNKQESLNAEMGQSGKADTKEEGMNMQEKTVASSMMLPAAKSDQTQSESVQADMASKKKTKPKRPRKTEQQKQDKLKGQQQSPEELKQEFQHKQQDQKQIQFNSKQQETKQKYLNKQKQQQQHQQQNEASKPQKATKIKQRGRDNQRRESKNKQTATSLASSDTTISQPQQGDQKQKQKQKRSQTEHQLPTVDISVDTGEIGEHVHQKIEDIGASHLPTPCIALHCSVEDELSAKDRENEVYMGSEKGSDDVDIQDGVNLLNIPGMSRKRSRSRSTSKDGRSKSHDGRSEPREGRSKSRSRSKSPMSPSLRKIRGESPRRQSRKHNIVVVEKK